MFSVKGITGNMLIAVLFCASPFDFGAETAPARLAVREIQSRSSAGAPFLSRPAAIVCDDESVYVLDSADADIKIYSKDGAFLRTIGRKGQGPAEFRLPNDMDVLGGRIYVADSANRRVQIMDAGGRLLGGFGLGLTPWRILVLDEDMILVAGLPSGRAPNEKLISCLRRNGTALWKAVAPRQSGDPVYDALRNQLFLKKAAGGGFSVIRGFDDRAVSTMSRDGFKTAEAEVPAADLSFKKITVPTAGGKKRPINGFCWSCAADSGRLYLLSPEYTDDHDLGPGNQIVVLGETLELESLIELPDKVTKFAVAGDTIYAIDTEATLRIFVIEGRLR